MDRIKNYLKLIVGCLIIALTINIFLVYFKIMPAGIFGFDILFSIKTGSDIAWTIAMFNAFFIILGFLTLSGKVLKKAILPSVLIPTFVYLTEKATDFIDISGAELIMIAMFGGALIGIGSKLIYEADHYVSGNDIINAISGVVNSSCVQTIEYIIDAIVIVFTAINFGIEIAMYSLVTIIIIELISMRSRIGISNSKVFYIITNKEKEVKKFILDDLKYDITIFDVKGGFSQNKNKILMSAIPTKDYYKLKLGIQKIDPSAFISITDSFEVVNENRDLHRRHKLNEKKQINK